MVSQETYIVSTLTDSETTCSRKNCCTGSVNPKERPLFHYVHWSENHEPNQLTIAQALNGSADHNDWEATFTIDLAASRTESRVVFRFDRVQLFG